MKVGIMQPYFFPYVGYWQLISVVDKYVIYDDVNYINKSWINRNFILINGEAIRINLFLKGASQNKKINEIEILDDKFYKDKFLKTIKNSYNKAPYFSEVFPIIQKIIYNKEKKLSLYLKYLIEEICSYLLIDTELLLSSELNKNNQLKGQEKILEICRVIGADTYYNAIGGQDLYSYEEFEKRNIRLRFLKSESIEYKQFNNKFIGNLSIIDIMMFNSVEKIREFLKQYHLI